ncbi:glycosyltransferase [Cyanobium sp. WAJ14-Wanaka]|uniref:glycosyltransferase n=1 Tax=Cyanobium sp. WAJ14-Wanaka TaxID=2823725 RepID=UPI0020CEF9D3|nr:glycosyltransferase [Cyanobium sp. WAJ14-Wanaka]MCP9775457.1 glycosyltransferase [Cyanobium sp. WAJ14-Wanaka]
MVQPNRLTCDLTELFAGSLGRGGFYGIARVVAEIANGLSQIEPELDHVVYFAGINRFVVVDFDFELFASGRPAKLGFEVQRLLFSLDQQLFRLRTFLPRFLHDCLRDWLAKGLSDRHSRFLDTKVNRVLFSAARPKFIASYLKLLESINAQGFGQWRLASLLHDFFPLLDQYDRPGRRFVDQFSRDNALILESSSYVFANSYFTKQCLLELQSRDLMPASAEVHVAQLAHECRTPNMGSPLAGIGKNFFLAVGCRPGRKNLEILLDALLILNESEPDGCHLVLAGAARTSTKRLLKQPRYQNIRPKIHIQVTPSQSELVEHYQRAMATVLPSYSEGWGLPASESLWLGTPVLASDTPVMHEVCGDLGLYFSPDQPAELANLMQRLLCEPLFLEAKRLSIQNSHADLRKWAQTSADIASVLLAGDSPKYCMEI